MAVPNRLRSGEPGRCSAKLVLSIAMTANNNKDNSQPSAAPSESEPLSTDTPPANTSSDHASSSSSPTPTPTPNRAELLDRARHFLGSPQVIHQDYESKRRFLTEKGLEDGEIQLLLSEMVRLVHAYPQPNTLNGHVTLRKSIPSRSCPSCHRGCTPHLRRPVCQASS